MSHHALRLTFLPSRLTALSKSRLMRLAMPRLAVPLASHHRSLARPRRPHIMRAMLPRVSPLVTPLVLLPLDHPMRCLPTPLVMPRVVLRLVSLRCPLASPRRLLTVLATSPTVTRRPRLRVLRPLASLLKSRPVQRATTSHRVPRLALLLAPPHLVRLLRSTLTALVTLRTVRLLESPRLLLANLRRARRTQAVTFPMATRRTSRLLILAQRSRPMRRAMPLPV